MTTPLDEVLSFRRGVCQDFAHLAIGCVRSMGLAARYVSGYLETAPPCRERAPAIGADASHAWLSVFVPGWGWLDLDPTNDQIVGLDLRDHRLGTRLRRRVAAQGHRVRRRELPHHGGLGGREAGVR